MVQPPTIRLLVQFPMVQLLQVPRLPLLCLGQPFLSTFVADSVNVDRVVVAGMGCKQAIVPVWRADRRSAVRHHRKRKAGEFLADGVTLAWSQYRDQGGETSMY